MHIYSNMRRMYDLGGSHLLGLGVLLPQAPCALVLGLTVLPNAQSMSAGWPVITHDVDPAPCLHQSVALFGLASGAELCLWMASLGKVWRLQVWAAATDTPFAAALVEVHKSDATPNFSQQGAAVGKTKGRKARKKADEKPAPSEVEAGGDDQEKPAPKKAPRKRKTASATALGNQVVVVRMLSREPDDQDPRPKPIRSQ